MVAASGSSHEVPDTARWLGRSAHGPAAVSASRYVSLSVLVWVHDDAHVWGACLRGNWCARGRPAAALQEDMEREDWSEEQPHELQGGNHQPVRQRTVVSSGQPVSRCEVSARRMTVKEADESGGPAPLPPSSSASSASSEASQLPIVPASMWILWCD
eukprot:GHVU01033024.1.p2 GENE.GHVU01033024.1~~GHVU01033024.1.p2  ORF type:complete len:158 (+),score=8.02 GHVU01033024.1:846-1319(+)